MEANDKILFPMFEIPVMTEEVENILSEDLKGGKLFREMWSKLLQRADTVPIDDIGK